MFRRYEVTLGDESACRVEYFFWLRHAIDYAVKHYEEAPWITIIPVNTSTGWNRLYIKTPKGQQYNIWINNKN
jgi:hypothetical protein